MKKFLFNLLLFSLVLISNNYAQSVKQVTNIKICDYNNNQKEMCVGFFKINPEQMFISEFKDSIVINSNLQFINVTYNLKNSIYTEYFDKDYKAEFKKYDLPFEGVIIYTSKTKIKKLNYKYLIIIKSYSNTTVYLLDNYEKIQRKNNS